MARKTVVALSANHDARRSRKSRAGLEGPKPYAPKRTLEQIPEQLQERKLFRLEPCAGPVPLPKPTEVRKLTEAEQERLEEIGRPLDAEARRLPERWKGSPWFRHAEGGQK